MSEPHERLEEAMKTRRLALRPPMNWRELADAAGISYEALRSIRRGGYRPGDITAQGIDDALKWERGSTLRILDGRGGPVPLDEEPPERERELSVEELADRLATLQREHAELRREFDELQGRRRQGREAG